MIYIIKHSTSENAKYTMEEKVMRYILQQLDISPDLCEYNDSLKTVEGGIDEAV